MSLALGLESSCDETAAAVVTSDGRVLSSHISSQIAVHRPYGGVVPEIAARNHLEKIDVLVESALQEAGVTLADITYSSILSHRKILKRHRQTQMNIEI